MNHNYDFPEVVHPPGHFHHAHSYDLKNLDPFGSQPIYGDSEEGAGTSRWSSMRRSRKYWAIAGIVLLVLVMAGAIAGGIIGSDLVKQKPSTQEQPLTDDAPSPPSPTSLPPANEDFSRPHESSRLATGYGGTTASNFRLVLLQDVDGDLAAVEWRGSANEHYKIKDRLSGDSGPDKPAEDSPLSLLKFGPQGDLHLFYFNEDLSFCHLVRRASVAPGGDNSWEIGALSAGDSDISFGFAPSLSLKLSATVLPRDWTGLDADCMVLMYWTDETVDSVALLSSTDPETRGSWRSGKFSLSTGSLGLEPHPTSSGFLMMAIQRPVDNKGSDELTGGLRLVWDLNDNSQQRTFGIMDCVFTDENALSSCQTNRAKWEGTYCSSPRHIVHAKLTLFQTPKQRKSYWKPRSHSSSRHATLRQTTPRTIPLGI
jgi:hypothetical protein